LLINREDDSYWYRRGEDQWLPLKERRETINVKGKTEPVVLDVLEADHCVIETKPLVDGQILPSGLYLCRAWGEAQDGGHGGFFTFNSFSSLFFLFLQFSYWLFCWINSP